MTQRELLETRVIPRLRKFCKRHDIDTSWVPDDVALDHMASLGLGGPPEMETLNALKFEIRSWVDEGETLPYSEYGKRLQMARRVWQRAVQDDGVEFGVMP